MPAKAIATGDFVFFAPEGESFTLPTPGTIGRTAKPSSTDTSWISLGNVESFDPTHTGEKKEEVWGPAGQTGVLTLHDVVTTKQGLEFKIISNEVTPLAIGLFYRAGLVKETDEQFNPLSKVPLKGWLKVQRFDQDGEAHLIMDVWVRIQCDGGMKSGDGSLLKPEFTATVLYSPLNTAAPSDRSGSEP